MGFSFSDVVKNVVSGGAYNSKTKDKIDNSNKKVGAAAMLMAGPEVALAVTKNLNKKEQDKEAKRKREEEEAKRESEETKHNLDNAFDSLNSIMVSTPRLSSSTNEFASVPSGAEIEDLNGSIKLSEDEQKKVAISRSILLGLLPFIIK